jgi:hypothetical protein
MTTGIDTAKQAIRMQIWDLLERERAVERGVHGYIPDFLGPARWRYRRRGQGCPDWTTPVADIYVT